MKFAGGTNFTLTEPFQITVVTDTNTVTLDRSPTPAGAGSSGAGAVGGARAVLVDTFLEALTAGCYHYIKADGTMTLTNPVDVALDGTLAAPMMFTGYQTTRGDNPTGDNRPLIAAAANSFYFDDFYQFFNIRVTTTAANGFRADEKCVFENCSSDNSSGTGSRSGLHCGGSAGAFVDCSASSAAGYAFYCGGGGMRSLHSYAHDSVTGYFNTTFTDGLLWDHCIADTCTTGFDASGGGINYPTFLNCNAYGGTTGIAFGGAEALLLNCEISSNSGTGVTATASCAGYLIDYCNFYNNGTDVSNAVKGQHCTANAPGYTDAAGGDFSLAAGSALLGAGVGLGYGCSTPSTVEQGAWQNGAGAGGGGIVYRPRRYGLQGVN